ncbi:hypothetical protein Tco_0893163 [Tanacetum coccineum]|uniref:Uncharacterized protein n=1 Tax=Tanacetum coccineum TaxID=301880 RepID=A0ABQ5C813_9ASTR
MYNSSVNAVSSSNKREDLKGFFSTTSLEEPKTISQALQDKSWVEAIQKELLQFKLQKVWVLVDLPYGKKVQMIENKAKMIIFSAVGTCGVPKTMTERSMVRVLQSQMPRAIAATPCGTTQVIAGKYEVQIDMLADMLVRGTRWQAEVSVRGTSYCSKWRLANQSVTRGIWRVSVRGRRVSVRGEST